MRCYDKGRLSIEDRVRSDGIYEINSYVNCD